MAYTKTQWNPGGPPGISAENLNKIEQGIADAHDKVDTALTVVGEVAEELAAHKNESATLENLGHVNHVTLTITLDANWEGESAPYVKTVAVEGILATDNPIIDVIMSGDLETDEARQEAWANVYRAVTGDNEITFYAREKIEVELPVIIKVVR